MLLPPSSGICSKQNSTKRSHLRKIRLPSEDSPKNNSFGFSFRSNSKEVRKHCILECIEEYVVQTMINAISSYCNNVFAIIFSLFHCYCNKIPSRYCYCNCIKIFTILLQKLLQFMQYFLLEDHNKMWHFRMAISDFT